MSKKLHLYPSDQIVRSVLDSVEITAACGLRKRLSREDLNKAKDTTRKTCPGCLASISERTKETDITILKRLGWTEHLERHTRAARWSYTIQTSTTQTWGNDFPLAG